MIYTSSNWVSIDSGNALLPVRCLAITWTNVDLLSIGPLGTNFSQIRIKIQNLPFMKMYVFCNMAAILSRGRWVYWHYPTLGCDIQGFRAMGLSVQYWPRWFQDFRRSDWLYHSEQMGPIWGSVTCQKKNLFCVWNKLFLREIKISQRRTRPVKSLWWQIVPMQESTNERKNLAIFEIMGLALHNGKTSNSEVPIDKINIETLEIFQNLKNIARFNLKLFYQI